MTVIAPEAFTLPQITLYTDARADESGSHVSKRVQWDGSITDTLTEAAIMGGGQIKLFGVEVSIFVSPINNRFSDPECSPTCCPQLTDVCMQLAVQIRQTRRSLLAFAFVFGQPMICNEHPKSQH